MIDITKLVRFIVGFIYRTLFLTVVILGICTLLIPDLILALTASSHGSFIIIFLDWMIDMDMRFGPIFSPKSFGK